MMSPHQTMWGRDPKKSHPRRCILTLWCKFTLEMCVCGSDRTFISSRKVLYGVLNCIFRSSSFKESAKISPTIKVSLLMSLKTHAWFRFWCFSWVVLLQKRGGGESMDPFFRNSFLFRKKTFGSMLDPQKKTGVVCNTVNIDSSLLVLVHKLSFFKLGSVGLWWFGRTNEIHPACILFYSVWAVGEESVSTEIIVVTS